MFGRASAPQLGRTVKHAIPLLLTYVIEVPATADYSAHGCNEPACHAMPADVNHRCSHLRGRRVLIVEDEHLIAWDLAEALTAEGAKVIGPKTSVDAALKALAYEHPPMSRCWT